MSDAEYLAWARTYAFKWYYARACSVFVEGYALSDLVSEARVAVLHARAAYRLRHGEDLPGDHIKNVVTRHLGHLLDTAIRRHERKAIQHAGADVFNLVDDTEDVEFDAIDAVRALPDLLPGREGLAVRHYYLEGKSTAESAALLGVSPSTARQLRCRGLKMLRSLPAALQAFRNYNAAVQDARDRNRLRRAWQNWRLPDDDEVEPIRRPKPNR